MGTDVGDRRLVLGVDHVPRPLFLSLPCLHSLPGLWKPQGVGRQLCIPSSCQTHSKQVSFGPRAPRYPSPGFPSSPQLCCSLRTEASGMRLGSEPASMSSRGLLPWLPARPRVFRDIFWGGAGLFLLSEARGPFSPRRTPGRGSSLATRHLPPSGSPVSCPRNPGLC